MSDESLPASEHSDPLELLQMWQWRFRAGVFVIVAAIVLSAQGSTDAKLIELGVSALAFLAWGLTERFPQPWSPRLLAVSLGVLAATGAFGATSDHESSIIAMTIIAMLAAGIELETVAMIAVGLAGVLAVEVGAVAYDNTDLGTVFGYPSLIAGLALLGRYRRVYRAQAEQARALVDETRRAQEESERAAALTERSRIAREIHDVLAHSLGALGIQLQATEVMLSEHQDIDRALTALASARRLVDEGLTETRRAVRALRTDAPPLPEALAAMLDDRPGALTVTGDPYPLGPAVGLALLRVAQEAITNATKHAPDQPPSISLDYGATSVELVVENALGDHTVTEHPDTAGGYGLAGMHERLRLIDGELNAGPAEGRWVVAARVNR